MYGRNILKSKKVRKKKVVLNSALAVIIGGVLMGCSANSESPEKLTKEKEVKKENPLSHEGTVEPQPSQNSVTKSVMDFEQVGLPKTGDSSSNVFFSLLGALTGFLGFSLIKKRKSER